MFIGDIGISAMRAQCQALLSCLKNFSYARAGLQETCVNRELANPQDSVTINWWFEINLSRLLKAELRK